MNVKIINRQLDNVVIEYKSDKGYRARSLVPKKSLRQSNGEIIHDNPHMGIPLGIDWGTFDIAPISASALNEEFRKNGIFTSDDLREKLDTARAIILGLATVTVNKLLQHARSVEES